VPAALITGAAGQDGLHLARHLRQLGYRIAGLVQFGSSAERKWFQDAQIDIELVTGDVTDLASLIGVIRHVRPDELYNLAAISSVRLSWEQPLRAAEVNGAGLMNVLEALRAADSLHVRVFQASSVQMFGNVDGESFSESTPVRPLSPYGASKAFAHFAADAYRRRYGMFVSCGVLGNHESPLRDEEFVVRRITKGVGQIAAGHADALVLNDLTATRDWGYAGDYVVAMHAALQYERAEDFVIATGELRSVEDVVAAAFIAAGITDWQRHVRTEEAQMGRAHDGAKGDITKARRLLGWAPQVSFEELIEMMVKADVALARDAR
jgi:GDPmannose 4,6-dehydratase